MMEELKSRLEERRSFRSIADCKRELLESVDDHSLEDLICNCDRQDLRVMLQWDLLRRRMVSLNGEKGEEHFLAYFLGYLQAHLDFPLPKRFKTTLSGLDLTDDKWLDYPDYNPDKEPTVFQKGDLEFTVQKSPSFGSGTITCRSTNEEIWSVKFTPPSLSDWGDAPSINTTDLQVSHRKKSLYLFGTTELAFFIYTFDIQTGKRNRSIIFPLTPPIESVPNGEREPGLSRKSGDTTR